MAWLTFGCVALVSCIVVAWTVFLLTLRLPDGWPLSLLTGIIGGVGACAPVLLAAPADHGSHRLWVAFVSVWPMVLGQLFGRQRARDRLARLKHGVGNDPDF